MCHHQHACHTVRCWLLVCILVQAAGVETFVNFFSLSSRNHSRTQVWGNVCPRSDVDTPTCGWEMAISASVKLRNVMVDGAAITQQGQNCFLLRSTACNRNLSRIAAPLCLSATLYGEFDPLVKPIVHAVWSQICTLQTSGVLQPLPYVPVNIGQTTTSDTSYYNRTDNTASSLDTMLGLCHEFDTVNSRSCLLLQHEDTCYTGVHGWTFPEEISLSECSTLCTQSPLCAGFNFRKWQSECEVISEEFIFEFGQTAATDECDYWQVIKRN